MNSERKALVAANHKARVAYLKALKAYHKAEEKQGRLWDAWGITTDALTRYDNPYLFPEAAG